MILMTGTLEQLRRWLCEEARQIAASEKADVVTAFIYDEANATFHLPVGQGLQDAETFEDPRLGPRSGRVAGKVVRERRASVAEHVPGHSPMDGPFARRERIRSAAGYPLLLGNVALGALFVSYRNSHAFGEEQRERLAAAAARLAKMIDAEAPWDELRQLLKSKQPETGPPLVPMLQAIVDLASDSMSLSAAIWLVLPDGRLQLVGGTGLTRRYLDGARAQVGDESWLSRIVETGRVEEIDDLDGLSDDRRFPFREAAHAAGWAAAVGFPLLSQGRVCGVIEGLSFESPINARDRDVLRQLADLAAVAVKNVELAREARVLGEMARELGTGPPTFRAVQVILGGALGLTEAEFGCIFWREGDKPFVHYSSASGEPLATCELPEGSAFDWPAEEMGYGKERTRLRVPIRMEGKPAEILLIGGLRPFTEHHKRLLGTLSDQVSVALGWSRLLLGAAKEIQEQSARLSDQERVIETDIEKLRIGTDPPYHLVAIQLIDPRERVIETVRGVGQAARWDGMAKHYLEDNPNLRDIQADIVLTDRPDLVLNRPLRLEILSGFDSRFDKWIYEMFHQESLTRIFVPMILVRDDRGTVIEGADLEAWLASWGANGWREGPPRDRGERRYLEPDMPRQTANGGGLSWEVIGTVEAGYDNPGPVEAGDADRSRLTIRDEQAVELAKSAARLAVRIYPTLLHHVFQTVVNHAVRIAGAEFAILYPGSGGLDVLPAATGRLAWELICQYPPRADGLGQKAATTGRAQYIPDPEQGHPDDELSRTNPEIYARGIRAMAAIPLVEPTARPGEAVRAAPAGPVHGILYAGFGAEPGTGVHRFTPEEIGWLERFAYSATDAIRHATTYTRMRDHNRLLANLHSVAELLVSIPEDKGLLRHVAWGILNVLGADVVTIYQYVQFEGRFETPPAIAGRLREERSMDTDVLLTDTPTLIVHEAIKRRSRGEPIEPLYAENSRYHPKLDPERLGRAQNSFVSRERITSSAAVPLLTDKEAGQEVVGLLFVNYRRPHSFPPAERKLIETLASTAAVAIKNGRLLGVFQDTDHAIIVSPDVDQVLDWVVRRSAQFSRAEYTEIRLFDPNRQLQVARCRFPADGADEGRPERDAQRAIEDWVLRNRQPALVKDYRSDERCWGATAAAGSECCVPLMLDQERVIGTLRVASHLTGAFQPRHQSVLVGFANQAALALLLSRIRNQLRTNEKLATLGGLTGTLLHRLKNDLLAIAYHSDCLKEEESAGRTDRARVTADKVLALTDSFREQVSRMRDWSAPAKVPVSLGQAVRQGLTMVPEVTHILREVVLPNDLPTVIADDSLLAELFGILAKNAIEAMPGPGEGRLTVRAGAVGSPDASWVIVRVEDTGTGIDQLTLDRLFQPKHSAKRDGLGIGLWLAHSYIELLGGRLDVETEVGRGTTFIVGLPAAPAPVPAKVSP
jgi:signal transduction histidine kinase